MEVDSDDSAAAGGVVWFFAVAFPGAVSVAGSVVLRVSVELPTLPEDLSDAFTAGVLLSVCARAQRSGASASNENMPINNAFFIVLPGCLEIVNAPTTFITVSIKLEYQFA